MAHVVLNESQFQVIERGETWYFTSKCRPSVSKSPWLVRALSILFSIGTICMSVVYPLIGLLVGVWWMCERGANRRG